MRIAFDLVSKIFFIVHFWSLYDLLTDPDTHDKIIFHLAARMTRVYSIYCRLHLISSELKIASPSNVKNALKAIICAFVQMVQAHKKREWGNHKPAKAI